jgi:hypothetical protein
MTDPSSFQVAAWIAAAVGAIIALVQFGIKIAQDKREFRRKQAQNAADLTDKIWASEDCQRAVALLDYDTRSYKFPELDNNIDIDTVKFHRAMRTVDLELSEEEIAIRDGTMDKLFLILEQAYARLRVNLVVWSDIAILLYYPIKLLRSQQHSEVIAGYAKAFDLIGTYSIITDDGKYPLPASLDVRTSST